MCGIAGIFSGPTAPPPTLEQLRGMAAMLSHRGPDGYGLYRDAKVGLAHARLSLIDLTGGAQPIRNGDGSVWLCFNGEIFNYVELRRHLVELGHRFYTEGDSEVIVQCYERYGPRCWQMLNGQFAFALWDERRRQLWLVRDRLGIVPLHYTRVGNQILFASEAKALFATGALAPRLDQAGLAKTFSFWSVAAPHTVFDGVRMVRPATALCFDAELGETATRYWLPDPHALDLGGLSTDDAVDALEEQLQRAVTLRLRADVPVGAYISGGLDSSVIGSLAKDEVGSMLETFGIGFDDPRFDETPEQNAVVDWLDTRHHGFRCGAAAIRDALSEVTWHCEAPLLRTSPVPLYLLAGHVRAAGMRTVLTGEGADELLAGYTIFKEDAIRRFWARQPDSTMRPALLNRIHHYIGGDKGRSARIWQSFFARDLSATDHPFYSHLVRWHNTAWTLRLLAPSLRRDFDLDALMAEAEQDYPPGWRQWEPLQRAAWTEIHSFMSPWLLSCQGDRVAMAHGVEARYPFLDPNVVDFCLALPQRHKMIGLRDKMALRRLAARRLPQAVSARRKQPFRAPIGRALFGPEAEGRFDDALGDHALAQLGLVDVAAVGQLLRKARQQGGQLSEREEMGLVGVLTLSLLGSHFGKDFPAHVRAARQRHRRMTCHVFIDRLAHPAG
ncbi:MAG: asparagine synthase (glutamine-hydrolyzing) [Bacteroidota bacterium]